MKYTEVMKTVKLILECGDVPLIIGESGIGKTALISQIARENNLELVTIDANLLKEGEIGGLPIVKDYKTLYAIHYKLARIKSLSEENIKDIILFIDELNRCDHTVMQELMNLILNREINGFNLPDNVKIIAAMNPSNRYDNFEDSDYQVVDMDPAQEDRFVWIDMDSDIKEWLNWGFHSGNIDYDILDFLGEFPSYLHVLNSKEHIKATPRSWERISKAYRIYKNNKEAYSKDIFLNVVRGNVGISIATDFINYISQGKKPIIKVEDLFAYDVLPVYLKEDFEKEAHSRLYLFSKNALRYVLNNQTDKNINIFSQLLSIYPRDLRLGIMKEIKRDGNKEFYNKLLDCEEFINSYFGIYVDV